MGTQQHPEQLAYHTSAAAEWQLCAVAGQLCCQSMDVVRSIVRIVVKTPKLESGSSDGVFLSLVKIFLDDCGTKVAFSGGSPGKNQKKQT
jgi:hypothetical protein